MAVGKETRKRLVCKWVSVLVCKENLNSFKHFTLCYAVYSSDYLTFYLLQHIVDIKNHIPARL